MSGILTSMQNIYSLQKNTLIRNIQYQKVK